MSGDSYDLAYGPNRVHRVHHNGQARYERETFEPMTELERAKILAALEPSS